jgi:PPE-repeat protein
MPNPAEPPEVTSGEFWGGPGAGTFFASAAQMEALAGLIIGMLGGHSAVEAALSASWPAPTGMSAVAANVPHMLWLGTVATMLQTAGAQIAATGEQFEVAKMATATPAEVAYNQSEHVALNAANFLGFLTPYIMANRAEYSSYWVRGVSNKASYEAASAAGVQAIPPLPPPPPTAAPLTGGGGSSLTDTAASPESLLAGQGSPMQMMMSLLPMAAQMPSQLGGMASGGSLSQLPQQALQQVTSLAGQFGSLSPDVGAEAVSAVGGDWVTATPAAGGPVTASLPGRGGGAGGGGGAGMGGAGAMAPASALRSPGSWSSTVNAAAPSATTEPASASRIVEARTGGTVASGMGSPGAMMSPAMAHGATRADDDKRDTAAVSGAAVLSTAADAFRVPAGLPTISGGGGNDFATAKGGR